MPGLSPTRGSGVGSMLERSQTGLRLSVAQSGWPAVDAVAVDAVAPDVAMSLVDLLGCAHAVAPNAATAGDREPADGPAVGRRVQRRARNIDAVESFLVNANCTGDVCITLAT